MLQNHVAYEEILLTNESKSSRLYVTTDMRVAYISAGRAQWQIAGQPYDVRAGDVVLLSNQNPRMILRIEEPQVLALQVVSMGPQFVHQHGFLPLFLDGQRQGPPVIASGMEGLGQPFAQIKAEVAQNQAYAAMIISALALILLALLARRVNLQPRLTLENSEMIKVLDYVDSHYADALYLEALARMASLSPGIFARQFKRYTGLSCFQYIKHKRIEQAIVLLGSTDSTVLQIAMDCGYDSMANFYKAFKDVTGKRPSDYATQRKPSQE